MSWYLLKNRRHVGPYSEAELEGFRQNAQLERTDFVISQSDLDSGLIKYRAVTEVLKFPPMRIPPPPRSKAVTGIHQLNQVPNLPEKNEVASESADQYEPPLGSFSEDEIMNNEVSRVFTQLFDSVDLAQGTHAGQPSPPKKPSGKTHIGAAPVALTPAAGYAQNAEGDSTWKQYQKLAFSPGGLITFTLLIFGIGIYMFGHSGAFEKSFKGLASQVGVPVSTPKAPAARRAIVAKPVVPVSSPVAAPAAQLKLPEAQVRQPAAVEIPQNPVSVSEEVDDENKKSERRPARARRLKTLGAAPHEDEVPLEEIVDGDSDSDRSPSSDEDSGNQENDPEGDEALPTEPQYD